MTKFLAICFMMTLFSFSLVAMQRGETAAQADAELETVLARADFLINALAQRNHQADLKLRESLKEFKKLNKIKSYKKQQACACCDSCVLQ